MKISHFAMPLTPEKPGGTNLDLRFDMLLTNLEKVPLIFRVRFVAHAFGSAAVVRSALNGHVILAKYITFSGAWIVAGERVAIQGDAALDAGQMIDVGLLGSGLIPDAPAPLLGMLSKFGLQGTVAITLPVVQGAAQLDHPARVLASTFLRPAVWSAPRVFFPLVGGSPEFAIPPDVARLVFVPRAASRRKARRRGRK